MASPITHIVFALKVLYLLPPSIDHKAFIVGTSFPDIRYMAQIGRETTHIEPVSWEAVIAQTSSFRAGMLFHNLVDNLRIRHFEFYFYNRYSTSHDATYMTYFPLVMKFAEDAVLYAHIAPDKKVYNYFDLLYPEELALCPHAKIIKKWHSLLQQYCFYTPTVDTINAFLVGTGGYTLYTAPLAFNCSVHFNTLLDNPFFTERVISFYNSFEELLSKNNHYPNRVYQ